MPRPLIHVHKFGGASVADAAAMRHAAAIVHDQPRPAVVVVSALAGVTDALLAIAARAVAGEEGAARETSGELRARYRAIARAVAGDVDERKALLAAIDVSFDELDHLLRGLAILHELTPRTSDFIVSRGERLSARLLASALVARGVRAQFVDALEVVRTDGAYGGASPDLRETDRAARGVLLPLVRRGIVPVLPGFLGGSPEGHATTLGRGGSDLSATLIGRALAAADVSLWKDVPGLLTADPRIVTDARVIPQMNAREAAELAYYGAKVLHPRALIPLAGRSIPLRVRPFADPASSGTEISGRRALQRSPVKALSAIPDQAMLTVTGNGMLGVPGIAARTFAALHGAGISVSLISQASSEHSICLSVPQASAERARASLLAAFRDEIARREIDGVELRAAVATIAVVGMGMHGSPGIAARVFSALADGGINIVAIAQGSSELNISMVVDGADLAAALRRIHGAFQLSRIGGGAIARPEQADVVLLGFGQIGRSLARMLSKVDQPGVALRIVGVIDRSGYVFDARGLSARRLAVLAAAKRSGTPLARAAGGHAAGTRDAVAHIARHALSRPIFVDLTADETTSLLRQVITGGMDVVLANKRPLSGALREERELRTLARSHGRRILHETTVGAGLPIIDTYHKLVESGDRILRIEGCTSGTLGFLMTELERGRRFSDALRRAMERGYTEPDPREDLSGMDVGRKALILARLLGHAGELDASCIESLVPDALRAVPRDEFLARLDELDPLWEARVRRAREGGRVLRYIASVTRRRVRVELAAVDARSPFAALEGTDNQVVFTTTRYRENPLVITGPGAGPAVTAAGVLNDVLALAAS